MWCNQNQYLNIIPDNKIELSTSFIHVHCAGKLDH